MKETGFVVNIRDGFADVRVARVIPGGCCSGGSIETSVVKARNLCNAEIGNRVAIERVLFSSRLQLGLCVAGFVAGLIAGDQLGSGLGFTGPGEALSLGAGVVVALLVFLGFRLFSESGKNAVPKVCAILS
jgi:hypothetical protein